jgi:tetratricopeptide (TPR) repeat protein
MRRRPDGPLTIGDAVRIVRAEFYVDKLKRRGLTQPGLYGLCRYAEEAMDPPTGTKRWSFREVSLDRAKKKIHAIEVRQDVKQVPFQLLVIAKAMSLPDDFFSHSFASKADLKSAYDAALGPFRPARAGAQAPRVSTNSLPEMAEQHARPGHTTDLPSMKAPEGFLRLSAGEVLPQNRLAEAANFSQILPSGNDSKSMLVLLQGRTGVGKTFFLSYWLNRYGAEIFGGNALSVDCSLMSFDQILAKVEQYFVSGQSDKGSVSIFEALAVNQSNLIVLDGLKLEHFSEGSHVGALIAGVTPGRRPQLRDLAELVAPFLNRTHNTVVIVCLENNSQLVGDTAFVRLLDRHVQVVTKTVEPLDDDEGAEFLGALGLLSMDIARRRRLSGRLHGLPGALDAAARDLMRLAGAEREHYLDNVAMVGAGSENDFERFFRASLSWYESRIPTVVGSADPHPQALLRLLALMPGPITEVQLDEILRKGRVKRLRNLSSDQVMRGEFPFTSVMNRTVDVHGMVRGILRAEIDDLIERDAFENSNTDREELERIHWLAARFHWNTIKRGDEPNSTLVTAIESFVYHMMAQIRLIPKGSARRGKWPTGGASERVLATFTFEEGWGRLSNGQIWSIAFDKAVKPLLIFDRRHRATRIHGQYEAKARILQLLTNALENGVPVVPTTAAELYKETAVCWMHAGRLRSAGNAATRAGVVISPQRSVSTARRPSGFSGTARDIWKLRCDIASVTAAVDLRRGRRIGSIEGDLRPLLLNAQEIAKKALAEIPFDAERPSQILERGAIRILARTADLALHAGRTSEAIKTFELADTLQHKIRGRSLDGEAARKFILALIRTRDSESGRIARAIALVEENIDYCANVFPRSSGEISNDIIPFLVLRSALQRVSGKLEAAEVSLEAVRRHDFVRKSECTFVASVELEFEETRLEIACGRANSISLDRMLTNQRRLNDARHWMMALEAVLLAAECCAGELRHRLLRDASSLITDSEAVLREADVDELFNNKSAVARFGL